MYITIKEGDSKHLELEYYAPASSPVSKRLLRLRQTAGTPGMEAAFECEECGRTFCNTAGLFTHQKKKCRPGKRSIKELLLDARDYWKAVNPKQGIKSNLNSARKHPRLGPSPVSRRHDTMIADKDVLTFSQTPRACADSDVEMRDLSEFEPQTPGCGSSTLIDNSACSSEANSSPTRRDDNQSESVHQGLPIGSNTCYTTKRDKLGLFKRFLGSDKPMHDPELKPTLLHTQDENPRCPSEIQNTHTGSGESSEHPMSSQDQPQPKAAGGMSSHIPSPSMMLSAPSYHPYPNWSSFALGNWYWSKGVVNSKERFGDLIRILSHTDFKKEDVCSTSWDRIHRILPNNIAVTPVVPSPGDSAPGLPLVDDTGFGWSTAEVNLDVPFPNRGQGRRVKPFKAGVLHHRSIVLVIKEKFADPEEFIQRHYQPYEHMWQPCLEREPIRVYGELYTSNEYLKVQEKVQRISLSNPSDAGLERVVVALMFWSDATLLANFGTAKLWPCYLFFGNDSKYMRAKPSANLCSHVAYFEMLPDSFKDWYFSESKLKPDSKGHGPSQDLVTYCNRQMFHRQWDILLDDQLAHAMEHGIRISCPDGITRLFFPWVFTYSADYPEKALVGTIRSLGQRPCPRCLTRKCELHQMGTQNDLRSSQPRRDDEARQQLVKTAIAKIVDEGYAVGSDHVEDLLREDSMLPIQNAFSRLSHLGFDVFSSLVVDLMHEFELGVWKALFIHLIRILEARDRMEKSTTIHELDRRYRQMPSFGSDACALPAFDNLLPEPHNSIVCYLLALCAEWHALAKLRLHTEDTLQLLESTTVILARQFNIFTETTCSAYQTTETSKEYTARLRRASKAVKDVENTNPPPAGPAVVPPSGSTGSSTAEQPLVPAMQISASAAPKALVKGRLTKTFNLNTYKYHALADYASTIRSFGTTDSYSTERGELEHKVPKSWYLRTDKKTYRLQLARIERRRANLRKIAQQAQKKSVSDVPSAMRELDGSGLTPALQYRIAKSQSTFKSTTDYVPQPDNGYDPALLNFIPDLQKHLLPRLKQVFQRRDPMTNHNLDEPEDWTFVSLRSNRIYEHKTVHLGYTTYDCREEEDLVRASGSKNTVMVLNPSYPNISGAHPFLYAKVQGIFHANVLYTKDVNDPNPEQIYFLWVRWFRWEPKSTSSYGLDILSFPPVTDGDAFGFLDPCDVVRGCYITPRFWQKSLRLYESVSTIARDSEDFAAYFVNPFPDRDMFMRYQWGYAVGHAYTHPSNLQSVLTPAGFLPTHLQGPANGMPQSAAGPSQRSTMEAPGECSGTNRVGSPLDILGSSALLVAPSVGMNSQDVVELHPNPAEQTCRTDIAEAGEEDWVFRQDDEDPPSGDDCNRDSDSEED